MARKSAEKRRPGTATDRPAAAIRVLISISGDHVVGRRILAGVADYAEHHQRWQHYLELNRRDTTLPEVDGIIASEESYWLLEGVLDKRTPIVQVTGIAYPGGPPAVIADNHAVGRMGANYLADLGLTDLAFVSVKTSHARQRAEGFADACAKRARRFTLITHDTGDDESILRAAIRKLPTPVGIMAATDRIGLDVSRACRLIGRRIPDDVALMGVDNELEICRLVDPPLTSIDHGSRRIGYEAARVLDEWLTTGRQPTTVTVEPIEVVPRQSTDLLAIDEPDVVEALRYIRSNFHESIKVRDVLRHVAMSRRSLEIHFKSLLGRTIHDEILRVRIEHAKHLLLTSEWSMPYIADECGFALASQFSSVFRRETGEAPQAFRKRQRGGIKAE